MTSVKRKLARWAVFALEDCSLSSYSCLGCRSILDGQMKEHGPLHFTEERTDCESQRKYALPILPRMLFQILSFVYALCSYSRRASERSLVDVGGKMCAAPGNAAWPSA